MLQAQTGFATPYCIQLPGSPAPPGKDWVQTNSYLCQAPAARAVLCSCPSLSLGCTHWAALPKSILPCSGTASLILSQQTWFILSSSDQRQGFSVTWLDLPYNSQPPAGGKQTCRREKLLSKQSQKTYSKSCDCFNIASKINTFGSCMMKTGKWNKNK